MSFKIRFSGRKPHPKPINDNVHNELDWEYAWRLARNSTPINKWPHQYTTHYIYEFMNRPWLPVETRLKEMTQWLCSYAPDLELKI